MPAVGVLGLKLTELIGKLYVQTACSLCGNGESFPDFLVWGALCYSYSSYLFQFYQEVRKCLTAVEIGDYLECSTDPTSETTLFGLTKQDLDKRNPHKRVCLCILACTSLFIIVSCKHSTVPVQMTFIRSSSFIYAVVCLVQHLQSIQQKVIPEIESRLWRNCETLVDFCQVPTARVSKQSGKWMFQSFAAADTWLDWGLAWCLWLIQFVWNFQMIPSLPWVGCLNFSPL